MNPVQQESTSSITNAKRDDSLVLNLVQNEELNSGDKSLNREDIKQSTSFSSMRNELNAPDKTVGSSAEARLQDTVGKFFSVSFTGSLEKGHFNSVNDVYVKYSVIAGPDWVLGAGMDVGITQIARCRLDKNDKKQFIWNQPISISYKSYNFYGWPQLVLSVYYFDTFGNDVILGYGCTYLPVCKKIQELSVSIYSPRSPSLAKRFLCFVTGRKPELINASLIARPDCRCVLQMVKVGEIDLLFNIISKDILSNGYKSS